jgi:photosystem II stability/assembly factor-like uncharacterized protein
MAFVLAAGVTYLAGGPSDAPHVVAGPGSGRIPTSGTLPAAGATVPAFDLWSDPVFPTLSVGYAIERHLTAAGPSEALARSEDAGRTWHLVGNFPFASGYVEVQFISVSTGYAFGPAGLAVTRDGGARWVEGQSIPGRLQRVVPIGSDVWATFDLCHGPPEPATPCTVHLAISTDSGLRFSTAPAPAPLPASFGGGDILARISDGAAYVVTYGPTGGGLAVTRDDGASWARLADPCSSWPVVDLAAPAPGFLWMICGGARSDGGSAKAVFQSFDGARRWRAKAYTGFGPDAGPLARRAPFGRLPYEGQLSQLATINPVQAWIGVSGVGVLVTADHGREWSLVRGMSRATAAGGAGVGVTFDDARHGWAIELRRGVWQTSNGVDWQLVDGT